MPNWFAQAVDDAAARDLAARRVRQPRRPPSRRGGARRVDPAARTPRGMIGGLAVLSAASRSRTATPASFGSDYPGDVDAKPELGWFCEACAERELASVNEYLMRAAIPVRLSGRWAPTASAARYAFASVATTGAAAPCAESITRRRSSSTGTPTSWRSTTSSIASITAMMAS